MARPLCVLDCETTGTSPQHDRVVEIGIVRYTAGAEPSCFACRVNPGIPIPDAASAVHGIRDADVADCPHFRDIAFALARFMDECDLCGFNIRRFDLPLLCRELDRAGVSFALDGRRIIDVQQIYHQLEPRNLAAAVRHFLGRDHLNPHGAVTDACATADVLDRMLAVRADLPRTVEELHNRTADVDLAGRLRRDRNGRLILGFGKYVGQPLGDVARGDAGYLEWLLRQDFLPDFKVLVTRALAESRE